MQPALPEKELMTGISRQGRAGRLRMGREAGLIT